MRLRKFYPALAAAVLTPFAGALAPVVVPPRIDAAPMQAGVIASGDAASNAGRFATVEGVVREVYTARNGSATFVDLDGVYPDNRFTAVIYDGNTDVHGLEGRTVDISGTIRMYGGRPEIVIRARDQIRTR